MITCPSLSMRPISFASLLSNLTNQRNTITTDQDQRQDILPPKTDSPDKLYNLSLVYGIAGGDESFVKRRCKLFLDTMPLGLQEMQKKPSLQNWAQVGKLAHKLKSTIDLHGHQFPQGYHTANRTKRQERRVCGANTGAGEFLVESIMLSCAAQVKKDFSL